MQPYSQYIMIYGILTWPIWTSTSVNNNYLWKLDIFISSNFKKNFFCMSAVTAVNIYLNFCIILGRFCSSFLSLLMAASFCLHPLSRGGRVHLKQACCLWSRSRFVLDDVIKTVSLTAIQLLERLVQIH